jgi:hypothetical protein
VRAVPFNLIEWSYETINVTLVITGRQPNGGFDLMESDVTYQFGVLGHDGLFTPTGMYRYVESLMKARLHVRRRQPRAHHEHDEDARRVG